MIVGKQKPLEEIRKMIDPYERVLVLGCGTCVKTCFAGGEDDRKAGPLGHRLSPSRPGAGAGAVIAEPPPVEKSNCAGITPSSKRRWPDSANSFNG